MCDKKFDLFYDVKRSGARFGGRPQGGRHRRQAECETACRRRRGDHLPSRADREVIVRERRRPAALGVAVARGRRRTTTLTADEIELR